LCSSGGVYPSVVTVIRFSKNRAPEDAAKTI